MVHGNELYIPKKELPPALRNRIVRLAAFQNPEFYRAQAMRLPTFGKPRVIGSAEDHAEHIALPRGCLGELGQLCRSLGIRLTVDDKRNSGVSLSTRFLGRLQPGQQQAVNALVDHDTGVLAATTALGRPSSRRHS